MSDFLRHVKRGMPEFEPMPGKFEVLARYNSERGENQP
jgi:hypothetical protein